MNWSIVLNIHDIGTFLSELEESTFVYRIETDPVVDIDSTVDQLYRYIIPEFSERKLISTGYEVINRNGIYYLKLSVIFNDDKVDLDEEYFLFEEFPISEFSNVFKMRGVSIPRSFKDNITIAECGDNLEVEFIFDQIEPAAERILPYIIID